MRRYFDLLEHKDVDGWLELWAEGAVQFIPYATGDLPTEVRGKDELGKLYRKIAYFYKQVRFTVVEIYPLDGADRIFARWHPVGELVAGGEYSNDSIGLFDFDEDGKITSYTEWFNPLGFGNSFSVS